MQNNVFDAFISYKIIIHSHLRVLSVQSFVTANQTRKLKRLWLAAMEILYRKNSEV